MKSAYSVSVCNHCGNRGHKKADCRNLAQPSGGGGQGGGKHVALAYKNLSLEEYRKLVANQRPKGRGLPKESFAWKPGVRGLQHTATSVCTANQFDAIAPLAEMDD